MGPGAALTFTNSRGKSTGSALGTAASAAGEVTTVGREGFAEEEEEAKEEGAFPVGAAWTADTPVVTVENLAPLARVTVAAAPNTKSARSAQCMSRSLVLNLRCEAFAAELPAMLQPDHGRSTS